MSTHTSSSSRMLGLDGIRALAVIGVVWHHAHPGFGALPMSRNGFLGVDAFFVLSGFLITVLLLREQAAHGSISLRQFYVRRALRIFPLYYAVLALLALYFLTVKQSSQGQAFLQALPYHLTFLSNWVPVDSLMAITWSLSSEEQFYLLWPPLLVWLGVRRALPLLIGFLLLNQAVNFGWLDAVFAGNGGALSHLEILQTTFTPIVLGVLLAFVVASPTGTNWLRERLSASVTWALAIAVLLLANWPSSMQGLPRLLTHLVMVLLLAAIVYNPSHLLVRWLEYKPLAYVGTISYGVYLLHKLAQDVAQRLLDRLSIEGPLLLFVLTMAITLVLAACSYRYFERPFVERRLPWRPRQPVPLVARPSASS